MRINNNIFSNSINNVGFNNVGFNNANSIYNINDSLLLSGQNLDYLIPLLLMFLRNMLNSFNNSFSPISMNPIGGFGSPVDGKIEQAAEEMKKYVHDSNGQVLAGLVRRRDEESKWLLNANENNNTNQRNNSNESTNVGNNANNSNKDNNTNSNNNVDNNNTQSSQATQNDRNNHRGNNDLNNTNISVVQNLNFHQGDTVNIQFLGYFGRGPVFGNNTFNK